MPLQLNRSIVDVEPWSVGTPRRVSNYSSAGILLLLVFSLGDTRTLSPRAGPISRGVIVFMLWYRDLQRSDGRVNDALSTHLRGPQSVHIFWS